MFVQPPTTTTNSNRAAAWRPSYRQLLSPCSSLPSARPPTRDPSCSLATYRRVRIRPPRRRGDHGSSSRVSSRGRRRRRRNSIRGWRGRGAEREVDAGGAESIRERSAASAAAENSRERRREPRFDGDERRRGGPFCCRVYSVGARKVKPFVPYDASAPCPCSAALLPNAWHRQAGKTMLWKCSCWRVSVY